LAARRCACDRQVGWSLEGRWVAERDHEHAVGSRARLCDCQRRHQGRRAADLAKTLLDKCKIWTNAIDSPAIGVQGVRITPHLFIQPAELDVLVRAISEIARA
jgi:7-keto-8-aminopelargonate synthetase-like enzyme